MNPNEDEPTDSRSDMAKALDLVSQIISISLVACLPAGGGYLVDRWLNTKIVFVLVGLALGMAAAGFQLTNLVNNLGNNTQPNNHKDHDH